MARPKGGKIRKYSIEEKEKIIKEYLDNKAGLRYYAENYQIAYSVLHKWYVKYLEKGIDGLNSETGRKSFLRKGRPKKARTEEERLQQEIAKLEIEVARLKKGYFVKGVGVQKEYVTTQEENMK